MIHKPGQYLAILVCVGNHEKKLKDGRVHHSTFFFMYQSNRINLLIAHTITLKIRDFKKFRAAISLDHETLTTVLSE